MPAGEGIVAVVTATMPPSGGDEGIPSSPPRATAASSTSEGERGGAGTSVVGSSSGVIGLCFFMGDSYLLAAKPNRRSRGVDV